MVRYIESPKVLITGGTGYLGARIGDSLADNGYTVYLGSRKPSLNSKINNCFQLITDWDDPELLFCNGFDLIIHAAGINAQECAQNPDLAMHFNGEMTRLLARKSLAYGCKKFFYFSTVHVYKSPLLGTFDERSATYNHHPYAISHLNGENALLKISKNSSLSATVLRLSNCFGYPLTEETDCWNLVLNQFIRDALLKGKITIKGDSSSKRDFLPITEFNRILLEIIARSESTPKVINISTGVSKTLLEIAILVSDVTRELTGNNIEIVKEHDSKSDLILCVKNNALRSMNIFPRDDLINEIRKTLQYLIFDT